MMGISQVDIIKNSGIAVRQWKSGYVTVCQVCGWHGYPHEKIIVEFEGIRSEEEDGYVDIFTEFDYESSAREKRTRHIHKYNPKLVQESLDLALKIRNDGGNR